MDLMDKYISELNKLDFSKIPNLAVGILNLYINFQQKKTKFNNLAFY